MDLVSRFQSSRSVANQGLVCYCQILDNHFGDVMVSMLASSAVDRGFNSRSDQTRL